MAGKLPDKAVRGGHIAFATSFTSQERQHKPGEDIVDIERIWIEAGRLAFGTGLRIYQAIQMCAPTWIACRLIQKVQSQIDAAILIPPCAAFIGAAVTAESVKSDR